MPKLLSHFSRLKKNSVEKFFTRITFFIFLSVEENSNKQTYGLNN